jgi:hypothetical protein
LRARKVVVDRLAVRPNEMDEVVVAIDDSAQTSYGLEAIDPLSFGSLEEK